MNTNTDTTNERGEILAALLKFARQRSRLEFGNYGNSTEAYRTGQYWPTEYRTEVRAITAQLRDARKLLRAVEMRPVISAADIKEGFGAYSGRLSWDGQRLDYCTGQYWPTEYRAAVCAVLAQVLWRFFRDCAPKGTENLGWYIRAAAARQLGRSLARRFFN